MATTIEELFKEAICVDYNDIYYDIYSSRTKKFNSIIFLNMNPMSFNTCNGILSFTDTGETIYSIPKYEGYTDLLKENGFRWNSELPVPLADNLSPKSKGLEWEKLIRDFSRSMQPSFSV